MMIRKKNVIPEIFFLIPIWAGPRAGLGWARGREVGARKPQVFEASKTWPLMIGWQAITEEAPFYTAAALEHFKVAPGAPCFRI